MDDDTVLRAELKHFMALWDHGGDEQPDPHHFGVAVWVFIGSAGEDACDRFDAFACTPSWLNENFARRPRTGALAWMTQNEEFIPGLVLMSEWDETAFGQAIDKVCNECHGPTWPMVANQISRYLPWEFDYRYDRAAGKLSTQ